jgi:hypothetical protein
MVTAIKMTAITEAVTAIVGIIILYGILLTFLPLERLGIK